MAVGARLSFVAQIKQLEINQGCTGSSANGKLAHPTFPYI